MSDLSESLMVAHLFWATWADHLHCSFVKSDGSKSLKSLLKIEQNIQIACFLRAISSNHERIALRVLFCKEQRERIAHGCSLKWAILSERAESKWAKEQIPNPEFISPHSPTDYTVTYIVRLHYIFSIGFFFFKILAKCEDDLLYVQAVGAGRAGISNGCVCPGSPVRVQLVRNQKVFWKYCSISRFGLSPF